MLLAIALSLASQNALADFQVPMWADFAGDSQRVVAPGTRVTLWSIACEQTLPNPETGDTPYECFPARLHLPSYAQPMTGAFESAREEMARMRQCFDVHVEKAPTSIVKAAIAQDLEPVRATVAKRSATTPTVVLVAWSYTDSYMRAFEYFDQTTSAKASADGGADERTWATLAIPPKFPIDTLTIGIMDAPGARGVVAAARAKDYRRAVQLARAALRDARDVDDNTKGNLRANLAAAAIFAGMKSAVPKDDGFNDTAVDSVNGYVVAIARRWAAGEVWLGPDPCAH